MPPPSDPIPPETQVLLNTLRAAQALGEEIISITALLISDVVVAVREQQIPPPVVFDDVYQVSMAGANVIKAANELRSVIGTFVGSVETAYDVIDEHGSHGNG